MTIVYFDKIALSQKWDGPRYFTGSHLKLTATK